MSQNAAECVTKPAPARVHYEDARIDCQSHFQSVQNLWYLATQEADKPMHVKLHLNMMGIHLQRLSKALQRAS
jgi:hypothetical protein